MRNGFRGLELEHALQAAIVSVIVTAVLAAGALLSWLDVARKLRWVALAALVALSLLAAARRRELPRPLLPVFALAAAFAALALVSTLWSGAAASTAEHAVALAALFAATGSLAVAAFGRPETARALLAAVLAGTAAVAVGGLLVLAFRHDRAIEPATTSLPARYQGLGGGPDTATMVLAVGLPLALWALSEARRRLARLAAAAVFLLLLGSIVASASRGALVGCFAGTMAYALLGYRGRRRLVAVGAIIVVLVLSVVVTRIPQPAQSAPRSASSPPAGPHPRPGYVDANVLLRLEDDVGHPPLGVADTTSRPRTLFGTSGRAEAWQGAIHQGAERPILGFGFGTEQRVFVDRYVNFNSNTPENSYIGLFLQLGLVGLASFLAIVVGIGVTAARGLGWLRGPERRLAAAFAGAGVAGLMLGFFQSYVYAVGNNATAAVWICAFLLAATTAARRVQPARH